MKKSLIIAAGIFTLLLNANAQHVQTPGTMKGEQPLQVKFIETQGNWLVFTVEVRSDAAILPTLSVDDAIEGELYSQRLKTGSKLQTMKIEKREDQVLDFKLVAGNKVYVTSFTTYAGVIKQANPNESSIAGL